MDVTVTDVPDDWRYEARVDGELAAFADYSPTDGSVAFTRSEVLPAFEGKGVGALVRDALDDVRAHSSSFAVCPLVSGWIARHSEGYGDLLYRSRTGMVRD